MPSRFQSKKISVRAAAVSQGQFQPSSLNNEKRTVEFIASTGAKGKRWSYDIGEFFEELEISESSVNMERFASGAAPLLDGHDRSGKTRNQIGVIDSARIENNQLICVVRFASDADSDVIFQKVKDGIVKSCSIGYSDCRYMDISQDGDKIPTLKAVRFTPMELSLVSIPFDAAAVVRNDEIRNEFELIYKKEEKRSKSMKFDANGNLVDGEGKIIATAEQVRALDLSHVTAPAAAEAAKKAIETERARVSGINDTTRMLKLDQKDAESLINDGTPVDQARAKLIEIASKKDLGADTSAVNIQIGKGDLEKRSAAMAEGIENRIFGGVEFKNGGQEYAGMSLMRVAEDFLSAKGENTRRMSNIEIADRAMHSTSDFPLLLANIASKSLAREYKEREHNFLPLVDFRTVNDFKPITSVELGSFGMEKVPQSGEIKSATLSESQEQYKVESFARMIGLTRQMIVNDDLNAIGQLPRKMAQACRILEEETLWELFTANAKMGDGKALFHADHNNLSAAAAISVTSVAALEQLIMGQKDLDGKLISLAPKFLIVPSALKLVAEQFLAQITATKTSDVNPYAGNLKLIVSPHLNLKSQSVWYMAASKDQVSLVEWARLAGCEAPRINTSELFNRQGTQIKVEHDFGMKVMNFRGVARNG